MFCTRPIKLGTEKSITREGGGSRGEKWETPDPRNRRNREKTGRRKAATDDDRPGRNKRRALGNGCRTRSKQKETIKCRTTNPFIIFFLRLRSKKPKEHVTVIARAAGKLWTKMTPEQRKKYIDLANAEKKRREGRKRMTRKLR
ncbi:PREDICTED: uncharacterized protein LOC107189866 [Dufourea novaeangliae]|uniref:uncharacterized protein LOC107189866 n=1 Tax=Dufourea novaeangliae TaxID=178035 RepID=UPI0007671D87|nr:PREDICTED: uncharacterized protein LOC107189866 [Dufourea novaeangliae]